MAPVHAGCAWLLVLGACVSLVLGSDCGKECALCVYGVLEQQSSYTSLTCSLECQGSLDSQKLRLCRNVLMDEETHIALNQDPHQQQQQEAGGAIATDVVEATSPEHQLVKKYGGFMKRYGGFMSRRSTESLRGLVDDSGSPGEEENIRLEILKIFNSAAEKGGKEDGQGAEPAKRYGGFMRRAGGEVQGNLLETVLGRGLKKRYGGFMRRVGRPEWLVDSNKNDGGIVLKRAWEEDGTKVHKRYGGFMD
ncbi:proenkephalin a [Genypterus blacodes]|uniref:proenkephalin a n=1 Tax=Genypterus blacodes TaxID=154954 RepID=UPI003F75E720